MGTASSAALLALATDSADWRDRPAPGACLLVTYTHAALGEWRNGRRAGLRSRCPERGVSVRPRPRLPLLGRAAADPGPSVSVM